MRGLAHSPSNPLRNSWLFSIRSRSHFMLKRSSTRAMAEASHGPRRRFRAPVFLTPRVPRAAEITLLPLKGHKKPVLVKRSRNAGTKRRAERPCVAASRTLYAFFRRQERGVNGHAPNSQAAAVASPGATSSGGASGNSQTGAFLAAAAGTAYVFELWEHILSGHHDLRGSPWVEAANAYREPASKQRCSVSGASPDAAGVLERVLRPLVFVWAPEQLMPGWRLPCPSCGRPTVTGGGAL